ncbi:hypothetical protein [Flavobacterium capsici]|uniref:Uncharacterized protein n=1 Tax=Flavobacterium capsici TaxID=3075618 RepID=A0AA96J2T7_9FLAO|nr:MULTISPECIES: hypothetical protein [unclassified Flavobacterium]WNM19455.1 hypothetical protein RN608_01945 [Flavobacterium sp. PMR2A8]WNM20844.1 hypothetical protein RN605_09115 [Flavobacterium sp. PMTSA4]
MNNHNFYIQQSHFFIDDFLLINAPSIIEKFLIVDDIIILLLSSTDLESDRNIYCFDFQGNLIWIISEVTKLHDKNYFTNIYINKNDELMAYNLNGIEVTIDKEKGLIINAELIK